MRPANREPHGVKFPVGISQWLCRSPRQRLVVDGFKIAGAFGEWPVESLGDFALLLHFEPSERMVVPELGACPRSAHPAALLALAELVLAALSTLGWPVLVVSELTVAPVLPPGSGPMLRTIGALAAIV